MNDEVVATTSFLDERPERNQSKKTSDVALRRQRSDQCHQRDGLQFAEEDPHQRDDLWETEKI